VDAVIEAMKRNEGYKEAAVKEHEVIEGSKADIAIEGIMHPKESGVEAKPAVHNNVDPLFCASC
jgi:hypothetical protein